MSTGQRYKARFNSPLPNGDSLSLTVWPGKTDPTAEVIAVQISRRTGDSWETVGRIAVYHTTDGRYKLLPERPITTQTRTESLEIGAGGEGYE